MSPKNAAAANYRERPAREDLMELRQQTYFPCVPRQPAITINHNRDLYRH